MDDQLRARLWDKAIELERDMHSLRGIFQNDINPDDVPEWCRKADMLKTDLSVFIAFAKGNLLSSKKVGVK